MQYLNRSNSPSSFKDTISFMGFAPDYDNCPIVCKMRIAYFLWYKLRVFKNLFRILFNGSIRTHLRFRRSWKKFKKFTKFGRKKSTELEFSNSIILILTSKLKKTIFLGEVTNSFTFVSHFTVTCQCNWILK